MQAPESTKITIDPTFWVAFFAFLTVVVNGIVTYKMKLKTEKIATKAEEIAAKVDGAATASLAEMAGLRDEISRLNEDRIARADAAPASPAEPEARADGAPLPVIIEDTTKPVPVDIVVKLDDSKKHAP